MGQSSSLLLQEQKKATDVPGDDSSEDESVDPLAATTRADMLLEVMRRRCVDSPTLQEATVAPVLKNCLAEDWHYAKISPSTVLLHIYDLPEFKGANEALSFAVDEVTLGGVFHAGVEVFGNEWSYGSEGVKSGVPRASVDHTYRCSIPLGEAKLTTLQVASVLHRLCQTWRGGDYELLGHNCCSFASELVGLLGVGPIPPWVDRFARVLDQGRRVGHLAIQVGEVLWEGLGGIDTHVVPGMFNDNPAQPESQAFERKVASVEKRNPFVDAECCETAPEAASAAAVEAEAAAPAPRGPIESQSPSIQISLEVSSSCSAQEEPWQLEHHHERCTSDTELAQCEDVDRALVAEQSFATGDIVEYNSVSHGRWIAAKVRAFDSSSGLYDLHCKAHVAPAKIRKRQLCTLDNGDPSSSCRGCCSSSGSSNCSKEVQKSDDSAAPSEPLELDHASDHHAPQKDEIRDFSAKPHSSIGSGSTGEDQDVTALHDNNTLPQRLDPWTEVYMSEWI